jgi:hypothetical protein
MIDEKKKKERNKKGHQRHIKVLITTTVVLLKRAQRDEYNKIRKVTNVDQSRSHAPSKNDR